MGNDTAPLLEVDDLHVTFRTPDGDVRAVDGVSFSVEAGKTLGIVGESGSGKSVTASTIMGLNRSTTAVTSGAIRFAGNDLLSADDATIRKLRGNEIAMIFQDPLSALNPYYTVGHQIGEAYLVHHPRAKSAAVRERVLDMMDKVGIANPAKRIDEYPHEFSGGMRQRIVIAIALINEPRLLLADEPTTALDVTVQAQILELMRAMQSENGSAIVLITHDLGVIAETSDDVVVMYAGSAVEQTDVQSLFDAPMHPYTLGLLGSVHSLEDDARGALRTIPGFPPSLINVPSGCAFHPRCSFVGEDGIACTTQRPTLRQVADTGTLSRCLLPDEQLVTLTARGGSA
jgi:peptide/nickel transport system ATP-binding protein